MTLDTKAERAICDAATPGPWEHYDDGEGAGVDAIRSDGGPHRFVSYDNMCDGHTPGQYECDRREALANAVFIARARTGYPAALDEIARLRAENADLRAMRDRVAKYLLFVAQCRDTYHVTKSSQADMLALAYKTVHMELRAAIGAPEANKP